MDASTLDALEMTMGFIAKQQRTKYIQKLLENNEGKIKWHKRNVSVGAKQIKWMDETEVKQYKFAENYLKELQLDNLIFKELLKIIENDKKTEMIKLLMTKWMELKGDALEMAQELVQLGRQREEAFLRLSREHKQQWELLKTTVDSFD